MEKEIAFSQNNYIYCENITFLAFFIFFEKTFSIPLRFNVKSKNNVFHVFYFLSFHFLSSFFLHSFTLFFLRFVITRIKQQLLIPSPVPSSPHVSTLLSFILTSLQFKFVPFFSNNYNNNNYFN